MRTSAKCILILIYHINWFWIRCLTSGTLYQGLLHFGCRNHWESGAVMRYFLSQIFKISVFEINTKTGPYKQCEFCIDLDKSFDQPGLSEWFDWSGLLEWSGWTFLGCSDCWLAPSSIFSHIHSHLKYYTFGSVSAGQEFSLFLSLFVT